MDKDQYKELIEHARKNDGFLHQLLFDTEKAVAGAKFLSPEMRETILKLRPEKAIIDLVTSPLEDCGVTVNCTFTCTHTASLSELAEQLGNPAADCGVTVNCGHTCGHTASKPGLDRVQELASAALERRRG